MSTVRTVRTAGAALALSVAATLTSGGHADATPARQEAPSSTTGTSGSIVYVKSANLFIARGDGTHARRLTTDGTTDRPYSSPSESDAGVIAAARGSRIVRMTQTGQLLNTIDPPALRNTAGESMDGAVNDVAISPDGGKIA